MSSEGSPLVNRLVCMWPVSAVTLLTSWGRCSPDPLVRRSPPLLGGLDLEETALLPGRSEARLWECRRRRRWELASWGGGQGDPTASLEGGERRTGGGVRAVL